MESNSAFFYGTLMHPGVLRRVIGGSGAHLKWCPAVLLDFTRHQVKHGDYPGLVPYETSKSFFGFTLDDQDARSVRGTVVIGLTQKELELLDIFEGNEYIRQTVQVHPLGTLETVPDVSVAGQTAIVTAVPPPLPTKDNLAPAIQAETYIHGDPSKLVNDLWSYEDFVQQNAWKWIGIRQENEEDFVSVVEQRNAAGTKARTVY